MNSVSQSYDSSSSALELPDKYYEEIDRLSDWKMYTLSISLQHLRHIETIIDNSNGNTEYWLSWSLLDVVIVTPKFSFDGKLPQFTKDEIVIHASRKAFHDFVVDISPLNICLCTAGSIIAIADAPYLNFPNNKSSYSESAWCYFSNDNDGNSNSRPAVHIQIDIIEQDLIKNSDVKHKIVDNHQHIQKSMAPTSPRIPVISDLEPDHHFRVCVQICSVSGIPRPSHMSVYFSYPYLGAPNARARSRPVWAAAQVETALDGCQAAYDFCKGPSAVQDILKAHQLNVQVASRTAMGIEPLGDALLNLAMAMSHSKSPPACRCPLTGKLFSSKDLYDAYRFSQLEKYNSGKAIIVPPITPIVIWSLTSESPIYAPPTVGNPNSKPAGRLKWSVSIEDLGTVAAELATRVKPGYKMHNAGVYETESHQAFSSNTHPPPPMKESGNADEDHEMDMDYELGLVDAMGNSRDVDEAKVPYVWEKAAEVDRQAKIDWEVWRQREEEKWRASLIEKEKALKQRLQDEAGQALAKRLNDFQRAEEEVSRLEVRLKSSIDNVERQKQQLQLKEEQMASRLAQKASELQLLERRVRDEAATKIDSETRRSAHLQSEIETLQESLSRAERRAQISEKDLDNFRANIRSMPETALREEIATLRAQNSELREESERQRRLRGEIELEKEHFRGQMHRLAVALKREREKSSAMARQEMEQLRLEFLAREERYL